MKSMHYGLNVMLNPQNQGSTTMKSLRTILIFSVALFGIAMGFVFSGLYPVGADIPHSSLTYNLLETLRERSIARASANLEVPNLDNPDWLLSGGPDYNEMCATCHLRPGKAQSDMSLGLYPVPPNLAQAHEDAEGHEHGDKTQAARRQFWIIKHGIKASGMPAWGITHEDERIWAMVAFLQKLPDLTPEQYQILTARGDASAHHH